MSTLLIGLIVVFVLMFVLACWACSRLVGQIFDELTDSVERLRDDE